MVKQRKTVYRLKQLFFTDLVIITTTCKGDDDHKVRVTIINNRIISKNINIYYLVCRQRQQSELLSFAAKKTTII